MFNWFKRFLENLAQANEKEFQGQSPDCCTINRPEPKLHSPEQTDNKACH